MQNKVDQSKTTGKLQTSTMLQLRSIVRLTAETERKVEINLDKEYFPRYSGHAESQSIMGEVIENRVYRDH